MHIGPLGGPEIIIIILVIVILIFGPKNLPKLGSAIGRTVKNLRSGMEGDDDEKKDSEKKESETAEAEVEDAETEPVTEKKDEESGTDKA